MSNGYFIELRNLRFESLPTSDVPDSLRDALDGWLPRGKGVFARLENRWTGGPQFDYLLISDDMIYFAILTHELTPRLLSLKCFKASDMVGFAFILYAADGASDSEVPQIRLMMKDGKRIKLILDPQFAAEAIAQMKALSTKNFFIC